MLDEISEGLAWVAGGRVVRANTALAALRGAADAGQLEGCPVAELFCEVGGGPPVTAGDAAAASDCELRCEDGGTRPVSLTVRTGADSTALWIVADRSALRAAQQELRGLRERVAGEAREREEMLTMLSHELRTPVTIIAGFNRLLLAEEVGPLNAEQRHFAEEAGKSCRRLDAFIANLLEVARQSKPAGLLERCEISLEATVATVLSFLKPVLDERRIEVVCDLAEGADRVRCDPMRIEQVLINLIGNAGKYAPVGGTVELSSRLARSGGEESVEISVADRGPGVLPEHRERIFERYFRAGESREAGGLGLGLAICREIVEAHGGRISVRERRGGGSRFGFTLPVGSTAPGTDGEGAR